MVYTNLNNIILKHIFFLNYRLYKSLEQSYEYGLQVLIESIYICQQQNIVLFFIYSPRQFLFVKNLSGNTPQGNMLE